MTRLLAGLLVVSAAAAAAQETQVAPLRGKVQLFDRQGRPKPPVAGVIVYLDELEFPPAPPAQAPRVFCRLQERRFVPELLPILAGTTVEFLNEDTLSHSIFSLSRVKSFDVGIFGPGQSRSVAFDRPGLVSLYCNIHPDVAGWLLVVSSPFFTTTDEEGRFELSDVPFGTATLRAWSPRSHRPPELRIRLTPRGVLDLEMGPLEDIVLKLREDAVSVRPAGKSDAP